MESNMIRLQCTQQPGPSTGMSTWVNLSSFEPSTEAEFDFVAIISPVILWIAMLRDLERNIMSFLSRLGDYVMLDKPFFPGDGIFY